MTPEDEWKLRESLARTEQRLVAIEDRMQHFITRWEFHPVRSLAYGLAGTVLSAILLAILKLVLK